MPKDKENGFRKVTSVDVAKHAGVSRSAVSRTFTPNASVSAGTREKVLKSAAQLGYRVNKLASSLTNNRSDLVGIVASNIDNPFRVSQIEALSRELMKHNLKPILLVVEGSEDPSHIIGMLLEYNVSGVIVTSDTPPQSICEECVALGVPMVLVNKAQSSTAVDRVLLDNKKSGELAAQELYDTGCRTMAVVTTEQASYSLRVRIESFVNHCSTLGIEKVAFFRGEKQDYQGGQRAAMQLHRSTNTIQGVFCASDYLALGFMDYLRLEQGVPSLSDLKIVSCDDIAQASWPIYNLSTIRQDTAILAQNVVQVLQQRIAKPNIEAAVTILDVTLVQRGTTR
ncbi:MAG: DNA-binding LacI/PurR family transcriptional regulator [Oceanospirillaceae bacterium]|jgi:DNA-binding LacI/PurR family transcriptional regulator